MALGGYGAPADYGMGGDTLADRKRQLVERMSGRGGVVPGFRGANAAGALGMPFQNPMNAMNTGLGGLWFNPFLASVAGRGENFDPSVTPRGLSQSDVAGAQAGQHAESGGIPGGNPSNTNTAGQAAVGAPQPSPGVPSAGMFDPSNFFNSPFTQPFPFPGVSRPTNPNILGRGGVY